MYTSIPQHNMYITVILHNHTSYVIHNIYIYTYIYTYHSSQVVPMCIPGVGLSGENAISSQPAPPTVI